MSRLSISFLVLTGATLTQYAAAGELTVVSSAPAANATDTANFAPIAVTFDRAVDPNTLSSATFTVFGRASGVGAGSLFLSPDGATVTFAPHRVFASGETVTVAISRHLRAADGSSVRSAGYTFQFWIRPRSAAISLALFDVIDTNAGPESSRPYGGSASDVNHDGFVDLLMINEDTNDLRVFLNSADGVGNFSDFIQPTFPLAGTPSPSEPGDFDGDGETDICVANYDGDRISVLLGNGDGTFGPQTTIDVGSTPVGVAAFDADGDGDVDIVCANENSDDYSVALNNGNGTFAPAATFDTSRTGERGLAAADMNNDGILDLVIGCFGGTDMTVSLGDGDGTYTLHDFRDAGGWPWMVVAGDLNGDGFVDAVAANGPANNAGIYLNNGAGKLLAPQFVSTDPSCIAVDLGDLDGDGDLDLTTSSFGGDWKVFLNNGAGAFAALMEFDAPAAASCASPVDIDGDRDLDLALTDELDDTVTLVKNGGSSPCPADIDGDGAIGQSDLGLLLACFGTCPGALIYNPAAGALGGDACVTQEDLGVLLGAFGQACP